MDNIVYITYSHIVTDIDLLTNQKGVQATDGVCEPDLYLMDSEFRTTINSEHITKLTICDKIETDKTVKPSTTDWFLSSTTKEVRESLRKIAEDIKSANSKKPNFIVNDEGDWKDRDKEPVNNTETNEGSTLRDDIDKHTTKEEKEEDTYDFW